MVDKNDILNQKIDFSKKQQINPPSAMMRGTPHGVIGPHSHSFADKMKEASQKAQTHLASNPDWTKIQVTSATNQMNSYRHNQKRIGPVAHTPRGGSGRR